MRVIDVGAVNVIWSCANEEYQVYSDEKSASIVPVKEDSNYQSFLKSDMFSEKQTFKAVLNDNELKVGTFNECLNALIKAMITIPVVNVDPNSID